MKPAYRWGAFVVLLMFTGLLAIKGIELWSLRTAVDGAGIGVYFLIFEINDRVLEADISNYAIGFFCCKYWNSCCRYCLGSEHVV